MKPETENVGFTFSYYMSLLLHFCNILTILMVRALESFPQPGRRERSTTALLLCLSFPGVTLLDAMESFPAHDGKNQIPFLILLRVRTVRRPAGITSRGPNAGRSLSIPQEGGRLEVAKQRIRAQQLTKQVTFSSLFVISHFHFLVQLAQVADWRRMSAAVAATHPGPGEHHALACRASRSSQREVGDVHLLSPPHQYNRSLSMDRLKQEVWNCFSMRAFNKSDCHSPSWRCCR